MSAKTQSSLNSSLLKNKFASCSAQAANYARCVVALAQEVEKDSCQKEFELLKACFARK